LMLVPLLFFTALSKHSATLRSHDKFCALFPAQWRCSSSRKQTSNYSGPKKVDHSDHLYLLTFFATSTPLGCPPIDLGWGPIVKGLMETLLIVEPEIGRQASF
jgi:hypothetical protein